MYHYVRTLNVKTLNDNPFLYVMNIGIVAKLFKFLDVDFFLYPDLKNATWADSELFRFIPRYFSLCRLGQLNTPTPPLQRGKTPNECPGYDTKQSDCEVPVILKL